MKKKFEFRYNHPRADGEVSAQLVGEQIESLREKHNGSFSSQHFLDASKPKESKTHNCFNWDDGEVAQLYRLEQASRWIACVGIVYDEEKDPVVANVSIRTGRNERQYFAAARAMSDEDMKRELLGDCMVALRGIKSRFSQLAGMSKVVAAIEDFEAQYERGRMRKCLKCEKSFKSAGRSNRICDRCAAKNVGHKPELAVAK